MKYLIRTVSIFVLSLLIFLPLVSIAAGPGAQKDKLVGHWTFEKGEELKDLTGNFPDIKLMGAKIANGALDVDAGKWAITGGDYNGPEITNMTLISWATIQDQAVIKGSLLCLDHVSKDEFNAIVFAERQPNEWMSGSSWFKRTDDFKPGFKDTTTGKKFMMAITYKGPNPLTVKGYRDGKNISGDGYEKGEIVTYKKGDAEAIWGKRHSADGKSGPGDLDCLIHESRIYATALTEDEIKGLKEGTLGNAANVDASSKLPTAWAKIKAANN